MTTEQKTFRQELQEISDRQFESKEFIHFINEIKNQCLKCSEKGEYKCVFISESVYQINSLNKVAVREYISEHLDLTIGLDLESRFVFSWE